jgi:hypothetical protein
MRRFNPSSAALVLAIAALFTALGGPAWAAGLINGAQIKNGSITSQKIGRGQIRSANLARGAVQHRNLAAAAVTATNVAAGALTAADIARNTFLPATGTAANSLQLGGLPADHFLQGTGGMFQRRIQITPGGPAQELVDVGLGEVDASCLTGPTRVAVSFSAEAQPLDLIESSTPGSINPVHGMLIGSTFTQPDPQGLEAVVLQVAQSTNSGPSRVATVWVTGDVVGGGAACILTAQALTTGA